MKSARETWRAVPGYEGEYEVSSLGRVRSLGIVVQRISACGKPYTYTARPKMLSTRGRDGGGYPMVNLKGKPAKVHRLVAKAFVPGYQPGLEVNHKNGVRADCKASNLEWVTRSRNIQHSYDIGIRKPPESKHNRVAVFAIDPHTGKRYRFKSIREAARTLLGDSCKQPPISHCLAGKLKQAYGFKWRRA